MGLAGVCCLGGIVRKLRIGVHQPEALVALVPDDTLCMSMELAHAWLAACAIWLVTATATHNRFTGTPPFVSNLLASKAPVAKGYNQCTSGECVQGGALPNDV